MRGADMKLAQATKNSGKAKQTTENQKEKNAKTPAATTAEGQATKRDTQIVTQ